MKAIIVGNEADGHVRAVMDEIAKSGGEPPVVIDAPTLREANYTLSEAGLTLHNLGLDGTVGAAGWLRRYAPSGWGAGIVAGSLEAAIHRSFLTLVGSIARAGGCKWLTSVDAMLRAEDRMLQLQQASRLGILTPRTVVTGQASTAIEFLGPRFVVKPLTLGYFVGSEGPRAVYTSEMSASTALELDFGGAPFVSQELIEAEKHLRVVTVNGRAWVASLDADGKPLDWREQEAAHREWVPATGVACAQQALRLADSLGIGYSSQDWLVVGPSRYFIDLNPGGQWLFLPNEVAEPVTQAIAGHLR